MSRGIRRWWRAWVLALGGLLPFVAAGCSPNALWWLVSGGENKKAAEVPLPAKAGKKEVTVAILAFASPSLGGDPNFAGSERELASKIGDTLASETKGDSHPIRVVEQSKIEQLKATAGQDWRTMGPAAIGKKLGADYVLDMTVNSISMYQPNLAGEFYQGRSEVGVVVYDVAADKKLKQYEHNSVGDQQGTLTVGPAGYRQRFLDKVATEIAHKHIPHVARFGEFPQQ